MVRRSSPVLASILAVVLILLAAVPVSAYGNVNPYHLRLTRLDHLVCGQPIRIMATLTDKKGHAVRGKTVHFEITKGKSGDKLHRASVSTDSHGHAITVVTLVCTNSKREVKISATGPNDAKARITLELPKQHDDHDGDHHHGRQGSRAAGAGIVATTGSSGTGTGPSPAPVAALGSASLALLPVGPAVLGMMILLAMYRRRTTLQVGRQATT